MIRNLGNLICFRISDPLFRFNEISKHLRLHYVNLVIFRTFVITFRKTGDFSKHSRFHFEKKLISESKNICLLKLNPKCFKKCLNKAFDIKNLEKERTKSQSNTVLCGVKTIVILKTCL